MKSFFLEWWISKRYLKPKGKERFFSIITLLSFFGISSGVTILIIVMSVMNGLRSELFDKIIGLNGHTLIYSTSDQGIKNSDEIYDKLKEITEVESVIPILEAQVLVMGEDQSSGALLRGVSPKTFKLIKIITSNVLYGDVKNIKQAKLSLDQG